MTDVALARLRDPANPALADLARLAIADATRTPLRELADARQIATWLASAGRTVTTTDRAADWLTQRIQAERARWSADARPVRHHVPPELLPPVRELLSRPYVPSEELVFRLIHHRAVKLLLGQVLGNALTRFARGLRTVDQGLLGGLGGKVAQSGRGLLGGFGQGLVGAVKDEVEAALERKVSAYLDQAIEEAIRGIATWVADTRHAEPLAQMRVSALDTLLDTPSRQIAAEIDKLGPEQIADVVLAAVRAITAGPGFVDDTSARIEALYAEIGDGTLGAWLDDLGLSALWIDGSTDLLTRRLRATVATREFEAWWSALHS